MLYRTTCDVPHISFSICSLCIGFLCYHFCCAYGQPDKNYDADKSCNHYYASISLFISLIASWQRLASSYLYSLIASCLMLSIYRHMAIRTYLMLWTYQIFVSATHFLNSSSCFINDSICLLLARL